MSRSDNAFPNMSDYLKPTEGDNFRIVHYKLTPERLQFNQLRDIINRRRETAGQEPGIVTQLRSKDETVMMTDSEMERRTNWFFIHKANGRVLVAGLGLGMVLLPLQNKEEVESVTVVEIHQEIIDMVIPQLPLNDKIGVICADIMEWFPPQGEKYDTIYFDIWDNVCGDNYAAMKTLHRRFARRLNRNNPHCWMSCWRGDEVKRIALLER